MQKQQIPLKNSLFLLLAAIIWGIAFVAQSVGMEYVGGFTFSAVRSLLGSVVLIPLILISGRKNSANTAATKANSFVDSSDGTVSSIRKRKDLIIGGISCGICLCLASNFQQFGIKHHCRKSRIYYRLLYRNCTDHRSVSWQKMQQIHLGRCCNGTDRSLPSVHYRRILHRKR